MLEAEKMKTEGQCRMVDDTYVHLVDMRTYGSLSNSLVDDKIRCDKINNKQDYVTYRQTDRQTHSFTHTHTHTLSPTRCYTI